MSRPPHCSSGKVAATGPGIWRKCRSRSSTVVCRRRSSRLGHSVAFRWSSARMARPVTLAAGRGGPGPNKARSQGRSKSRISGGFGRKPAHCIAYRLVSAIDPMRIEGPGLCNATNMYIGNAATPLAICRDVGNATRDTHGVQRTSSQQ